MQKKRILSLLLAVTCAVSLLAGCGGKAGPGTNDNSTDNSKHEPITMLSTFKGMGQFIDLVNEKYPEIDLEIIPYSGANMTGYVRDELSTNNMPDIYVTTVYFPGQEDLSDRLIDLSGYDFTNNFVEARLRDVSDNGAIYLLPTYYNCVGITYNKTLLDEHGWTLPTSLEELEALAPQVEAAGCQLALDQVQFPGYGFQYLFNILSAGYANTIEGRKWQNSFLAGEENALDNADLVAQAQDIQRWRDVGMLNFSGDPDSDTSTRAAFLEGNTLFMIGNLTSVSPEESSDEFGFMPYLSEDGTENTYVANVTKFVGLNKHLADPGNEQKLEDALHVMEVICTVDGMRALSVNMGADVLVPLKDFVIPEESVYKPIEQALNEGYVAPYIYTGWENVVVPVGEKMFSFMKGECDINAVLKTLDDNQYLLRDNSDRVYTAVTEELSVEDCAKLVGIQFTKASGADVALVSTNKWYQTDEDVAMNTKGVQCPLYAMPITDQELTAMLPTGWTGTIQTVTLTGTRVKELAETGYDKFGDGEHLFPYDLIMPDGVALEDDKTYTVVICGASKAVQEEGSVQDTGIVGLTVMQDYLSRFDTFSPADITWN